MKKYTYKDDPTFRGNITLTLKHVAEFLKLEWDEVFQPVYEFLQKMKAMPSGPDRARILHEILDTINKDGIEHGNNKPTCFKGCSHCCKMEVMITDDEAILYAKKIKEGLTVDMPRLRQQAKLVDAVAWRQVPEVERTCVFLGGDNLCRIYEERPLSCRKHFSVGPPIDCADIKGKSHVLALNRSEVFVSASYNLKPAGGTLPRMLLQKL